MWKCEHVGGAILRTKRGWQPDMESLIIQQPFSRGTVPLWFLRSAQKVTKQPVAFIFSAELEHATWAIDGKEATA